LNRTDLISVILTSYNWAAALRAVLHALDEQTDHCFEVLIADDGSSPSEIETIRQAMDYCDFPVSIVSQEDQGFRAAKIRNRAVQQAKGKYLVFLDGDCLPRPDFIERHRKLAEKGYWVPGNRILFGQHFTQRFLNNKVPSLKHSGGYWIIHRLRGNINRIFPLIYWPLSSRRKSHPKRWKGAKTCNLGIWRDDFYAVNGFDERYEGWGYEDSDLIIRLIRSGIYRKSGKFALAVFHLWHPEQDRSLAPENLARLQSIIANTELRAALGVDQYHE